MYIMTGQSVKIKRERKITLMTPKIVDKDVKREEILEAALSAFAKTGFSNTRIEDISEEAGIAKGTVYQYFKNKDELFFALYDLVRRRFHEKIFRGIDEQAPASEALTRFIVQTLKAFDEWQEFAVVLLDFWSEHRRAKTIKFQFSEVYNISRRAIAGIIEKGVKQGELSAIDPEIGASVLIAILDGIMLQRIYDPDMFRKPKFEDKLVKIVMEGLRKT